MTPLCSSLQQEGEAAAPPPLAGPGTHLSQSSRPSCLWNFPSPSMPILAIFLMARIFPSSKFQHLCALSWEVLLAGSSEAFACHSLPLIYYIFYSALFENFPCVYLFDLNVFLATKMQTLRGPRVCLNTETLQLAQIDAHKMFG